MKKQEIKIPIYFGELVIIYDKNWNKINKKYSYLWPSKMNNTSEACVFDYVKNNGTTVYVACFTKKPKAKVIAHECVHLVNKLFEHRGIKLDIDNDEAQAYMTGWFFEQIEEFFCNK